MNADKNPRIVKHYVKGLIEKKYTYRQASASTGYTKQWLIHLCKDYKEKGDEIFREHRGNFHPANKISQETIEKVISLYSKEYNDVNFSYFRECLAEYENIKIGYKSLRKILISHGFTSPERRKCKARSVHRSRVRRECEGDMLQVDGTPYAWFKKFGDNKKYCMCGAIDDATGKITALYITENECLYNYMEILRQTCTNYGVPRAIYSDRAAIFCVTPKGKNLTQLEKLEVMHEKRTQWQRILSELNIEQILAWSPEAKGRIERMWHTLQGQLPIWFFKHGISTVEKANEKLALYIEEFNARFALDPAVDDSFFIAPPKNLDDILMAQFERTFDRDGCILFQGTKFYSTEKIDLRYAKVTLCISERGIFARYHARYIPLVPVGNMVQQIVGENMSQVVVNIIYRYLYSHSKEISA